MSTVEEAANWKDRLPAIKPGSETAIGLATATLGDVITFLSGIPGTGVFSEMARQAMQRQLEKAQDILIEELKKGNLEPLTDRDVEIFVPSAYRFYEAAKQGEFEHNLRILARLMRGNIRQHKGTTADVSRFARALEGMNERELHVLSACIRLADTPCDESEFGPEEPTNNEIFRRIDLNRLKKRHDVPIIFEDGQFLFEILDNLTSRNLLTKETASAFGTNQEFYRTTLLTEQLSNCVLNDADEAVS